MADKKRYSSPNQAKSIIDILFDGKMLREDVTRDQMNVLEKLLDDMIEMSIESVIKSEKLIQSLNKK